MEPASIPDRDPLRRWSPQGERPARRLAAIVAVGLLIVASFFVLLEGELGGRIQDEDDGDDEKDDEPTDEAPLDIVRVVSEDETWEGRTGIMEEPVHVQSGAALELRDCDLEVPLEGLVFYENRPWIKVAEEGALVLHNSRLHVTVGPRLESAVIMQSFWSSIAPSISRAVNLNETVDPVLSFDVRWWGASANLVVGVQPAPSQDLVIIDTLVRDYTAPRAWVHHEVPLRLYASTIPRVVIFLDHAEEREVMLANLRVLDGGEELHNDLFGTGSAAYDGWYLQGVDPFTSYMSEADWGPIISSMGEVTLEGSTISAPSGLPRWAERVDPMPKMEAVLPGVERGWNAAASTVGGEVRVRNGNLVVRDSVVEYTPILVEGSSVEVEGSRLTGDADLLTLALSSGTIRGTEFISTMDSKEYVNYRDRSWWVRYRWALSIAGIDGPFPIEVTGCTFEGAEIAIDLTETQVKLEGCEFVDVSQLVIWDHGSSVLSSWEGIRGDNEFRDCEGHWYLETHDCRIVLTGPNRPSSSTGGYWDHGGYIDDDLLQDLLREFELFLMDNLEPLLYAPTYLVDPEGDATAIESVNLSMETEWGGEVDVTIDTGLLTVSVLMPGPSGNGPNGGGNDYDPEDYIYFYLHDINPANETGTYEFNIQVNVHPERVLLESLELTIEIDGELVATFDVLEFEITDPPSYWEMYQIVHNLTIPEGRFNLSIKLIALPRGWAEPLEVDNRTIPSFRVVNLTRSVDLRAFGGEASFFLLLVDSNVDCEVEEVRIEEGLEYAYIVTAVPESSRLSLAGIEPDPYIIFDMEGPGELGIRDSDLTGLEVYAGDNNVTIENLTLSSCWVTGDSSNVTIRDSRTLGTFWLNMEMGSSCLVEGVEIDGVDVDTSLYITLDQSTVVIDGSSIRHPEDGNCDVSLMHNSSVEINNTLFENVSVNAHTHWYGGEAWHLNVTGCTFIGGSPSLWVPWDPDPGGIPPEVNISSCRFSGPGAGLVLHYTLVSSSLGPIELEDGARLFAQYDPGLDYQQGSWSRTHRYLGIGPMTSQWPFDGDGPNTDDGWLFMDVTSDRSGLENPDMLRTVFYNQSGPTYNGLGWVIWFEEVDPTWSHKELVLPAWEPIWGLIEEFITFVEEEPDYPNWWE